MSSEGDLSQSPKPDASSFSFRPQRPSKKPTQPTAPTIPVATTPTPIDHDLTSMQRESPALPYMEHPTNLSQLVYTREWLYNHRMSEAVELDSASASKMRTAQVYRTVSPGSTSTSSSREFGPPQHRERRGSSGPRSGRSGSGSFGPSSSFPNLPGSGSGATSGKPRAGSFLSPSHHRVSSLDDNSSDASFGSRRDTPSRRIAILSGDSTAFQRELVALLNKLTVEKFESLVSQIVKKFDLIENAEVLTESVKLLHSKALREHAFCGMYADLAKQLDRIYPFEASEPIISTASTPPMGTTSPSPMQSLMGTRVEQLRSDAMPLSTSPTDRSVSPARPRGDSSGTKPRPISMLRKILLNNCYYVWQEAIDGKLALLGEDETTVKARQRVMGNMIFMGELYKRGLMPLKVLKSSADGLVSSIVDKMNVSNFATAEPHCIMLHHLLRSVGEALDKDVRVGKPLLDGYMESLKEFASHRGLQPRVRFLMRDVIDDRLNDWRPRRRLDGPMRLDEVKELLEADQINPTFTVSERIIAPSSEFDERQRARTSVSPAKRSIERHSREASARSSSAQRSGSGSGSRRGSGSSWTTLTLPAIKEPSPFAPPSPSSSRMSVLPKEPLLEFCDSKDPESLDLIAVYLQQPNNASQERKATFVTDLVNWTLDRSQREQLCIPQVLTHLASSTKNLISPQDIANGFTNIMKSLEDIKLDVPSAPSILGKALSTLSSNPTQAPLLSQDLLKSILSQCPASCLPSIGIPS
jgi:hypothetical protein